ncbi:MAG: alkaline phosphatase family protein [bacterium]
MLGRAGVLGLLAALIGMAGCSSSDDDAASQEDAVRFFEPLLLEQGIDDAELPVFEQALEALLADVSLDFVATRYGSTYRVDAARGSVFFRRDRSVSGTTYAVDEVIGENPIGRQDPGWIPAYEEELEAGSNPNGVALPLEGYLAGDPRLSFIEPEDDSYPFGYERVAAYFDHPDSADFLVGLKSYAHAGGALGGHGALGIVQSRCPLVFWGAGIRPGRYQGFPRQVDVAPTVAKLMGLPQTEGVDERGAWSRTTYLTWQDGHVLEEVLDGEVSRHVLVVVSDGLAHTELLHQIETRQDALPTLRRLVEEGAWFAAGSTANWPSVTYPGHNTIGSGLYGGHHGVVDNSYFLRDEGKIAAPIDQLILTEAFFDPSGPGESLHMAVHRAFGAWELASRAGAFTASLFDPSVKDADKADLELRDRFYPEVPLPPLFVQKRPEVPEADPTLKHLESFAEQLGEEIVMNELYDLFTRDAGAVPAYVILNFSTTDGTGHANGPHGDEMRKVLDHIDANLGVLCGWLEEWGILARTTIVLTSDHGLQIGDPSRSGSPLGRLDEAGIPYRHGTGLGVYLDM